MFSFKIQENQTSCLRLRFNMDRAFSVFEGLFVLGLVVLFAGSAIAETEVAGEVFGRWTREDSPYIVLDSAWVPEEESLLIMPGVTVRFDEGLGLDVFGGLEVLGEERDSVRFLPREDSLGWRGVNLHNSEFDYSFDHLSLFGPYNAFGLGDNTHLIIENSNINCVQRLFEELELEIGRGDGHTVELRNSNFSCRSTVRLTMSALIAEECEFYIGRAGFNMTCGALILRDCITTGGVRDADYTEFVNTQFIPVDGRLLRIQFRNTMINCLVEGKLQTVPCNDMLISNSIIEGEFRFDGGSGRIIGSRFNSEDDPWQGISDIGTLEISDSYFRGRLKIYLDRRQHDRNMLTVKDCVFEGGVGFIGGDEPYGNSLTVEKCLFNDSRAGFSNLETATIRNNTFVKKSEGGHTLGLLFDRERYRYEISNNIFLSTGDGNALFFVFEYDLDDLSGEFVQIKYNSVYGFDHMLYEIVIPEGYEFELDESNLSVDPMLFSLDPLDPHLRVDSPCIDAGDPDSPLDPDGTRADVGAFYYHQMQWVPPEEVRLAEYIELFSPYPNPFNSVCKLDYSLPDRRFVSIILYDSMGNQVKVLGSGVYRSGNHSLFIDSGGLSSGNYFVKFLAGEWNKTLRLNLVK